MERCYEIGKVNLKNNLFPHILLAVVFCICSYFIMSVSGLAEAQVAQLLEMYIALTGIILLVPVFHPEQEKDIRDLTRSKYTSVTLIQVVRFFEGLFILMVILIGYLFYLKANNEPFPFAAYYFGVLSEAFFLGSLGVLAYSLSDQMVIGYMIPAVYYVANFGNAKILGNFKLFSMMRGSYEEKWWLAIAGVIFLVIGLAWRRRRG